MTEVVGARPCEFCRTNAHRICPESIYEAAGAKDSTWRCPCAQYGHNLGVMQEALDRPKPDDIGSES